MKLTFGSWSAANAFVIVLSHICVESAAYGYCLTGSLRSAGYSLSSSHSIRSFYSVK